MNELKRMLILVFSRGASARGIASAWLSALALTAGAAEYAAPKDSRSLADLSIEQLMNESVTSVSKKETKLNQSPAAIAVVTPEDLRRLGITSIPEALRLVPGMDVGRIDSHTWALSARGFEGHFGNKLLVLIDGRAIYESTFAGVHWDIQDLMMDDLDRIEVIRGPGATLWGANAVNGVVNIITKSARQTQGTLVTTSVGTEDQPSTSIRYGGQVASNLYYRAYVKYFNRDGLVDSLGHEARDDWNATRGGFRMDWEPAVENLLTLQGDYYYSETRDNVQRTLFTSPFSTNLNVPNYNHGGNVLGRWTHTFSENSQLSLQTYYARSQYELAGNRERSDTFDLELQDRFGLGSWNDIVWGVGYRLIADDLPPSPNLAWTPRKSHMQLYTAFVQDDITIARDRLRLSLGSKFEHNDQTGFEVQPGARLLWTPTEHQTAWASVSRAVRTPARFERGAKLDVAVFQPGPGAPLFDVALLGDPNLKAEELNAYELGYRIEPTKQLSFDLAGYYNVYNDLIDFARPSTSFATNGVLLGQNAVNVPGGHSYGAEVSVQYKVTDHWRLAADYTWLHLRFLNNSTQLGNPQQQVRLRSYLDLPYNLEFNTSVAYMDRLQNLHIPSYVRLDLGLVWRPAKSLEVGVWGQNLLDGRHPEFPSDITPQRTEIPRSVLGKITWHF